VRGTSPIEYAWLRDGERVTDSTFVITNGTLTFRLSGSTEGSYQCIASNPAGVMMSNISRVEDAATKYEEIRAAPALLYLSEGLPLRLVCDQIKGDVGQYLYIWWRQSFSSSDERQLVERSKRITIAEDGSLVFLYVTRDDVNAQYSCEVKNKCFEDLKGGNKYRLHLATDTAYTPQQPVTQFTSPKHLQVLQGSAFKITCIFGGLLNSATATTTWLGPDNDVIPDKMVSDAGRVLNIGNASFAEHNGTFRCVGVFQGSQYKSYSDIAVTVGVPPRLERPLLDQKVTLKGSVLFSCLAIGQPTPTTSWFINGSLISQDSENIATIANGASLLLSNVQYSTSVACNISNVFGQQVHNAFVRVTDTVDSEKSWCGHTFSRHFTLTSTHPSTQTRPEDKLSPIPHTLIDTRQGAQATPLSTSHDQDHNISPAPAATRPSIRELPRDPGSIVSNAPGMGIPSLKDSR